MVVPNPPFAGSRSSSRTWKPAQHPYQISPYHCSPMLDRKQSSVSQHCISAPKISMLRDMTCGRPTIPFLRQSKTLQKKVTTTNTRGRRKNIIPQRAIHTSETYQFTNPYHPAEQCTITVLQATMSYTWSTLLQQHIGCLGSLALWACQSKPPKHQVK